MGDGQGCGNICWSTPTAVATVRNPPRLMPHLAVTAKLQHTGAVHSGHGVCGRSWTGRGKDPILHGPLGGGVRTTSGGVMGWQDGAFKSTSVASRQGWQSPPLAYHLLWVAGSGPQQRLRSIVEVGNAHHLGNVGGAHVPQASQRKPLGLCSVSELQMVAADPRTAFRPGAGVGGFVDVVSSRKYDLLSVASTQHSA